MSEISPKRSEILPEGAIMSSVAVMEARSLVADLIGVQPPGFKLKNAWPRLARMTGFGERRLKGIWHGEARRICVEEMAALKAAADRRRTSSLASIQTNADRLDAVAHSLEGIDADFHRGEIDRLRNVARQLRRELAGGSAT